MELRAAKSKLHSLQQEANDDLPAGLAGFEAAKEVRVPSSNFLFAMLISFIFQTQEAEAEKADLVAQGADIISQKTELGEAQKALQHQLNEVKALISEFEEKRAAFGVRLDSLLLSESLYQ
jgi:structural maintenance of chromosomes protein 6